jgi:hypothetical protein
MSIIAICPNGHRYNQADSYIGWPEGMPHCPTCFEAWKKEHGGKKNKGSGTLIVDDFYSVCPGCGKVVEAGQTHTCLNPMPNYKGGTIAPGGIPIGWQCPVCNGVNAPFVTACPNCKPARVREE